VEEMKVYRIEMPDGSGVCRVMGSKLCLLYNAVAHDELEHDNFDGSIECHNHAALLCQHPRNRFAFPDLAKLRRWFPNPKGRLLMQAAGAQCVEYEVPQVEASNGYQVIFDKTKATKTAVLDLGSLEVVG
jgi:hypothetical protein